MLHEVEIHDASLSNQASRVAGPTDISTVNLEAIEQFQNELDLELEHEEAHARPVQLLAKVALVSPQNLLGKGRRRPRIWFEGEAFRRLDERSGATHALHVT